MLNNDLYQVGSLAYDDGEITASLSLNGDHPIYQGHFPGQPVTPGACLLDMLKEVLEQYVQHPLRLKSARQIKFVQPIVPEQQVITLKASVRNENSEIVVAATIFSGDEMAFKFDGSFVPREAVI